MDHEDDEKSQIINRTKMSQSIQTDPITASLSKNKLDTVELLTEFFIEVYKKEMAENKVNETTVLETVSNLPFSFGPNAPERCCYLYCYATCHTLMVKDCITRFLNEYSYAADLVDSWKSSLNITSLSLGPCVDCIAFNLAVLEFSKSPFLVSNVSVITASSKKWRETINNLSEVFKVVETPVKMNYVSQKVILNLRKLFQPSGKDEWMFIQCSNVILVFQPFTFTETRKYMCRINKFLNTLRSGALVFSINFHPQSSAIQNIMKEIPGTILYGPVTVSSQEIMVEVSGKSMKSVSSTTVEFLVWAKDFDPINRLQNPDQLPQSLTSPNGSALNAPKPSQSVHKFPRKEAITILRNGLRKIYRTSYSFHDDPLQESNSGLKPKGTQTDLVSEAVLENHLNTTRLVTDFFMEVFKREMAQFNLADSIDLLSKILELSSSHGNFDDPKVRCAYMYYYATCHTLLIKECVTRFLTDYPNTSSLLAKWRSNPKHCSLSQGPGLDYIGFSLAVSEVCKQLTAVTKARIVANHANWKCTVDVLSEALHSVKTPLNLNFDTAGTVHQDFSSACSQRMIKFLRTSSVVFMFKTLNFSATNTKKHCPPVILWEILKCLTPGTVIFFMDSATSSTVMREVLRFFSGIFLHQPTPVVCKDPQIEVSEELKKTMQLPPAQNAEVEFFVWEKISYFPPNAACPQTSDPQSLELQTSSESTGVTEHMEKSTEMPKKSTETPKKSESVASNSFGFDAIKPMMIPKNTLKHPFSSLTVADAQSPSVSKVLGSSTPIKSLRESHQQSVKLPTPSISATERFRTNSVDVEKRAETSIKSESVSNSYLGTDALKTKTLPIDGKSSIKCPASPELPQALKEMRLLRLQIAEIDPTNILSDNQLDKDKSSVGTPLNSPHALQMSQIQTSSTPIKGLQESDQQSTSLQTSSSSVERTRSDSVDSKGSPLSSGPKSTERIVETSPKRPLKAMDILKWLFMEAYKKEIYQHGENQSFPLSTVFELSSTFHASYNATRIRCAYMYRYATCHAVLIKGCVDSFLRECPKAEELLKSWRLKSNLCSLSLGPGLDYLAFSLAVLEHTKRPMRIGKIDIITKCIGWKNTVGILSDVMRENETLSSLKFGSSTVLTGSVFEPWESEAIDCLLRTNVLFMFKALDLDEKETNVHPFFLRELISILNVGTVIFFIDTPHSSKIMKDVLSRHPGSYLYGPTSVVCYNAPVGIPGELKKVLGVLPVQSATADFFAWQKQSNLIVPSKSHSNFERIKNSETQGKKQLLFHHRETKAISPDNSASSVCSSLSESPLALNCRVNWEAPFNKQSGSSVQFGDNKITNHANPQKSNEMNLSSDQSNSPSNSGFIFSKKELHSIATVRPIVSSSSMKLVDCCVTVEDNYLELDAFKPKIVEEKSTSEHHPTPLNSDSSELPLVSTNGAGLTKETLSGDNRVDEINSLIARIDRIARSIEKDFRGSGQVSTKHGSVNATEINLLTKSINRLVSSLELSISDQNQTFKNSSKRECIDDPVCETHCCPGHNNCDMTGQTSNPLSNFKPYANCVDTEEVTDSKYGKGDILDHSSSDCLIASSQCLGPSDEACREHQPSGPSIVIPLENITPELMSLILSCTK